APERFVDLVPGLLIDDSVVLTLVENAFVVDHSGVEDAGQNRVERTSSERLPASDVALFRSPPLGHQADPLGFLKDRQRRSLSDVQAEDGSNLLRLDGIDDDPAALRVDVIAENWMAADPLAFSSRGR